MLSSLARVLLVVLLALTMAGCSAIAGIFKAGFWVGLIGKAGGAGQFAWINLQNASDTASEFVQPLRGAGVGIDRIVGGLQVGGQGEQQYVTESFKGLVQQYPGIGGGWLWNLDSFGVANAASYASALAKGLAGG